MQMNLMNILFGAPPAAPSNAAAGQEAASSDDRFAEFLGQEGQQPGQEKNAAAALVRETPAAALAAQEGGQVLNDTLLKEITPDVAKDLLASLEAFLAGGNGDAAQQELMQSLRQALEQVVQGDRPVAVSEMVDHLVQLQALQVAVPSNVAAEDVAKASGSMSPLMRMVAWMQQAIDNKRDVAAQTDDAQAQSLAALSAGLPSLFFRTQPEAHTAVAQTVTTQKAEALNAYQAANLAANDLGQYADTMTQELVVVTPLATTSIEITPQAALGADAFSGLPEAVDVAVPVAMGDAAALAPLPSAIATDIAPVANEDAANGAEAPMWLQTLLNDIAAGKREVAAPMTPSTQPVANAGDQTLPAVDLPSLVAAQPDTTAPQSVAQENAERNEAWLKQLPFALSRAQEAEPATTADGQAARDTQTPTAMPVAAATPHLAPSALKITPHAAAMASHYAHMPMAPADQVQVAIRSAAQDGIDKITIQLEPADLGRVEVRLHMAQDGRTHIQVTADKASTLDLLSRDAHGLERSLAESGIKADAGSMQFNLRQQPQFVNADAGGDSRHSSSRTSEEPAAEEAAVSDSTHEPVRRMMFNVSGGVDIHA